MQGSWTKRCTESAVIIVSVVALALGMAGLLRAQANLDGKLNLFFQESRFGDTYTKNANQYFDVTVYDDLMAKNRLALSYLLDRKTGTPQPETFLRHRIRSTLSGRPYVFSAEYTPPYRLTGATGGAGQKSERKRFSLTVNPEDLPIVNVTYERSDRYGGRGASRVDAKNENRLVTTGYEHRYGSLRATFRERISGDKLMPENERNVKEGSAGLTLESGIGEIGSFSASYDAFASKETIGGESGADVRIDNVRGLFSTSPADWISLSANFLGTSIRRERTGLEESSSQEFYGAATLLPRDWLTFQIARDVREIKEDGTRSLSDFARAGVTAQGYVRSGVRGRASVQRTFVLKSREGAFPSNSYFANLDTDLLPGARLALDFNVTQSENPEARAGRFQVRKGLDLVGYPRSDLSMSFSWRTLAYSNELTLVGATVEEVEVDLFYRPKPKFSTVLTATRSIDRRVEDGRGLYLSSTVTYALKGGSHVNFIYIRREVDGAREEAGTEAPEATYPNNYLLELVLMLSESSKVSVKYDIRDLAEAGVSTVLGITFLKRF